MKIPVFLLFLLPVFFSCHRPADKKASAPVAAGNPKLAVKSMQDDLLILWSAIKEMHPAYGIYTPPDSLEKAYKSMYASIDRSMSETEFINRVYPFLCRLRCGHTQLHHSQHYNASAEPPTPHLPFEVLVRHHRAWVTIHATDKPATGDELISVNGVPVPEIIDHGYDLYCGDGYNETFKELFLSEYDGFEDACYKYYGWKGPWRIVLRTPSGVLDSVLVEIPLKGASSPLQEKTDNYAGWTEAPNTDYLPLRFYKTASIAWFGVKSYQYPDTVIYKEAFRQIHQSGIKNLVIDLRHNTGGDIRIGAKLLSYLADSSFHIVREVVSRIPNPAVNPFEHYFDTARTESFNLGFRPGPREGAWYHIYFKPTFGLVDSIIPLDATSHFSGRLIVLIDGATFSAGAHTAAAIKAQCKNATFIGRETAGAEEGCSGGTIQQLTLPNTRVVVDFPWMRFISVARHPVFGHGIIPNYTVDYSPEDIVREADPDIKKVLDLLK